MSLTYADVLALFTEADKAVSRGVAKELSNRLFSAFRDPDCSAKVRRTSCLDGAFGGFAADRCAMCGGAAAHGGGDYETYTVEECVEEGSLFMIATLAQFHLKRRRCAGCVAAYEAEQEAERLAYPVGHPFRVPAAEVKPAPTSGASLTFSELVVLFHVGGLVPPEVAVALVTRLFNAFRSRGCCAEVTSSSLLDGAFAGYATDRCYKCNAVSPPSRVTVWDLPLEVEELGEDRVTAQMFPKRNLCEVCEADENE